MSGSEWIPSAGTETRGRRSSWGARTDFFLQWFQVVEACGRAGHSLPLPSEGTQSPRSGARGVSAQTGWSS